jgi:hypothetical protein
MNMIRHESDCEADPRHLDDRRSYRTGNNLLDLRIDHGLARFRAPNDVIKQLPKRHLPPTLQSASSRLIALARDFQSRATLATDLIHRALLPTLLR